MAMISQPNAVQNTNKRLGNYLDVPGTMARATVVNWGRSTVKIVVTIKTAAASIKTVPTKTVAVSIKTADASTKAVAVLNKTVVATNKAVKISTGKPVAKSREGVVVKKNETLTKTRAESDANAVWW